MKMKGRKVKNTRQIQHYTYIQRRRRTLTNVVKNKLCHNLLLLNWLGGQVVAGPEQGTYSSVVSSIQESTKMWKFAVP